MNKSFVEGVELLDILDPYIFDNHRDIINALFEVYFDISNLYVSEMGEDKHRRQLQHTLKMSRASGMALSDAAI